MKVFLSYPHTHAEIAASLAARLRANGHDVFWDHTSLPSGESFDDRIHDAIEKSELFVCLITGASLKDGKYARTELKFAEQKWPNPSGKVLPVALDDDAMQAIPPYLKAVTVERPEGDPVAEIVAEVERIAKGPIRRLSHAARILGILALAVAAGWLLYKQLSGNPIDLTVRMSGWFYADSTGGDTQALLASTDYITLLKSGLRGEGHADGERLRDLLEKDKRGPAGDKSPLPVMHFGIANNSGKTIMVDRLRLLVHESRVDERPLLWGSSRGINGSMILGNNGWGLASDIRFAFDLVAEHDLGAVAKRSSRRFEKTIPKLKEGATTVTAFWDELAAFGTNVSFLRDGPHPYGDPMAMSRFETDARTLKAALGARPDERFYVIGELFYSWGSQQSSRLSLQQELQFVYPDHLVGLPMSASNAYDIELKPEGTNYSVERQIAHSIESGATEAIDLRVWCEKGSLHSITAMIRVGEEWVEARDMLKLEYYRPVGSLWRAKTDER